MESNKVKAKRLIVKGIVMLPILLLLSLTAVSQTWNEFFKQKKTQIKYLSQQIAALQVYTGYLKQGYEMAGSGLAAIRDITSGEFNLHTAFIISLKAVNPAIADNAKVADIIDRQLEISKAFGGIRSSAYLSPENQDYVNRVKSQVLEECGKDLEELLLILTPGKVEMKDNERLERLDKVYESTKDKQSFTQSFINQVNLLTRQRANEGESINQIRRLYGRY